MKTVLVTAAKPHRSGFAGGAVDAGGTYCVPPGRVASLVRQGLIEDPAPRASVPKKGKKTESDGASDPEA